ncbi:hypothetical protein AAFX15_07725 (plasmid) [Vibrio chagasii]|uniref:hypothetical protein n=1 Tax=Vibrio TaxID=662 RepID=UPI000638AE9A|nr:hypothetical protein [Vibrio coralliirubri]CDT71202.1 conserved hypothetical protein [Vibrio coralliirubri]
MKVFLLDARLVRLFERLSSLNPSVGQMVKAINVSLKQYDQQIESKQDFIHFIDQVEQFKTEILNEDFGE